MPEETDGAPVSGGIADELTAAGFEDARQVGRGGAGVIYRCYETALGRNVAVKVLPSHFDDESRERFLREGYAMGGLSGHPNITHILRVGMTINNRPYIVMPYHAADSLAVRLRHEGPVPWPEALRIGIAWSVQQVDELPRDPWDMPLDAIVTETELILPGAAE